MKLSELPEPVKRAVMRIKAHLGQNGKYTVSEIRNTGIRIPVDRLIALGVLKKAGRRKRGLPHYMLHEDLRTQKRGGG